MKPRPKKVSIVSPPHQRSSGEDSTAAPPQLAVSVPSPSPQSNNTTEADGEKAASDGVSSETQNSDGPKAGTVNNDQLVDQDRKDAEEAKEKEKEKADESDASGTIKYDPAAPTPKYLATLISSAPYVPHVRLNQEMFDCLRKVVEDTVTEHHRQPMMNPATLDTTRTSKNAYIYNSELMRSGGSGGPPDGSGSALRTPTPSSRQNSSVTHSAPFTRPSFSGVMTTEKMIKSRRRRPEESSGERTRERGGGYEKVVDNIDLSALQLEIDLLRRHHDQVKQCDRQRLATLRSRHCDATFRLGRMREDIGGGGGRQADRDYRIYTNTDIDHSSYMNTLLTLASSSRQQQHQQHQNETYPYPHQQYVTL